MLYSVELGDRLVGQAHNVFLGVSLVLDAGELTLLDPSLLAGETAEVEYPGPADLTDLVQLDLLDERGLEGENPFHANASGNLADGERPGSGSCAPFLDDNTPEVLESFLVTFLDPIGNGDSVTGLEFRELSNFLVSERLLNNFHQIHLSILLTQHYAHLITTRKRLLLILDCKSKNSFYNHKNFLRLFHSG